MKLTYTESPDNRPIFLGQSPDLDGGFRRFSRHFGGIDPAELGGSPNPAAFPAIVRDGVGPVTATAPVTATTTTTTIMTTITVTRVTTTPGTVRNIMPEGGVR